MGVSKRGGLSLVEPRLAAMNAKVDCETIAIGPEAFQEEEILVRNLLTQLHFPANCTLVGVLEGIKVTVNLRERRRPRFADLRSFRNLIFCSVLN
jgi:hypothetical protein